MRLEVSHKLRILCVYSLCTGGLDLFEKLKVFIQVMASRPAH